MASIRLGYRGVQLDEVIFLLKRQEEVLGLVVQWTLLIHGVIAETG